MADHIVNRRDSIQRRTFLAGTGAAGLIVTTPSLAQLRS